VSSKTTRTFSSRIRDRQIQAFRGVKESGVLRPFLAKTEVTTVRVQDYQGFDPAPLDALQPNIFERYIENDGNKNRSYFVESEVADWPVVVESMPNDTGVFGFDTISVRSVQARGKGKGTEVLSDIHRTIIEVNDAIEILEVKQLDNEVPLLVLT
jgi:hypothetical protein